MKEKKTKSTSALTRKLSDFLFNISVLIYMSTAPIAGKFRLHYSAGVYQTYDLSSIKTTPP